MSPQPPRSRIVLDWFNVSYRSVILGSIAVAALAAVGVWYYVGRAGGPREDAREAIARASDRLTEAQSYPPKGRLDEVRGSARVALEEARSLFVKSQWDDARVAAIRSENLSQKAIDMARGENTSSSEVRIYRLEGSVRVKKAGDFAWEPVDRNTILRVGDQIKTDASSSVEVIYFDGTKTRVEPGSLLEIRKLREDPATRVREVEENLTWGQILASTQKKNVDGSYHEISTAKVTARTDDAGEFRVQFDKDSKKAAFDVFQGRVQVASPDRSESLNAGERIRASSEGQLTAKEVLPGVPRLIAPSDQRVFIYDDPGKATTSLSWEKVPGADRYHLLISNRPLFTQPLYDADRQETTVQIDGVSEGEYFWKVASVNGSGVVGPYSDARRFRVTTQKIRDKEDTTPPVLKIDPPIQTGPMLIINGKTEPGALLWVDNEKVDVYDDGSFYAVVRLRKEGANDVVIVAQDPAGNTTRLTHRAYVESY